MRRWQGSQGRRAATEIAVLWTAGSTLQEIGDELGLTRQAVAKIVHRVCPKREQGWRSTTTTMDLGRFRERWLGVGPLTAKEQRLAQALGLPKRPPSKRKEWPCSAAACE